MNQGGVLRNRMRLRAPFMPLVLSLGAVLLAGCGGSGGDRFVGTGSPTPREPAPAAREGRPEQILMNLEFLSQTDKMLMFVEEGEGAPGGGSGTVEEGMRKVAVSELARINAHHAYGWTHRGRESLDETGDISGFGVYVGVGGLGLEHNHEKILGRLFQSAVPYPEDAFDVLRMDSDAAAGEEFSARDLLASLDRLDGIDAVAGSFEARKKALVRSLTSQYYSDAEADNDYPDKDKVHDDYIIHIDDIKDLTDDGFDDQKRLAYLRNVLAWAEENDFTGPDDFDPENLTDPATGTIPVAGDGTTEKNLEDNFRYIAAVCTSKGDYVSTATGSDCPSDRPHFIDFGDGTKEGRDLRLIPDFSQRLLGSYASGLIANERDIHLANLSTNASERLTEVLELRAIEDLMEDDEKIARARELLPDFFEEGRDDYTIENVQRIVNDRIVFLLNLLEIEFSIPRDPETNPLGTETSHLPLADRIAMRVGILLAELRFTPEAGPVHGVAFGSRIVPHIANAALRIECAGDNEETTACLVAGDIRKSLDGRTAEDVDLDKLFADYIKAIPGRTEEAVDAGARGDGVVRAVDIFLLDAVVEGNGIARGAGLKGFLDTHLDETLAAIQEFLERRNNPVMVVRSGYGGFEGEPATADPDGTAVRGPRTLAALPYHYDACTQQNVDVDCRNFRGQILTAAALNMHNNELHENSPRCGGTPLNWNAAIDGRHYCLTAPGDRLRINGTINGNNIDLAAGYRNGSNTDPDGYHVDLGAASFVAGSLAVLSERFRGQLSGRELALRLVNTANQEIFYEDATLLTATPLPTEDEMNDPAMADLVRGKIRERNEAVLATYGAGLIDLEAASEVVGEEVVRFSPSAAASRNKLGSAAATYTATKVTTGAAFGDGLSLALHGREIVTFDEWNAPFWRPLSLLVSTSTNRRSLLERHGDAVASGPRFVPLEDGGLLAFTAYQDDKLFSDDRGSGRWAERYRDDGLAQEHKVELSLRQPVDAGFEAELLFATGEIAELPLGLNAERDFTHPYLGFAGEGIGAGGSMALGALGALGVSGAGRLTALGFSGSQDEGGETYAAHGGLLEYAFMPFPSLRVGMQTGALIEEERALGLRSSGAFGEMGAATTAFVGVSVEGGLGENWRFRAQAMGGRVNPSAPSVGLVDGFSGVATSAFRLGIEGFGVLDESDEFTLFVSQPLRVERGSVALVVPVGRTRDGALLSERIEGVSLAPDGREIEVSARYEFNLTSDLALGFGAGIVREGGHIHAQAIEFYGLGDLRFHF